MSYSSAYKRVLELLGWIEDQPDLWKIKRDEHGLIFLDFRRNPDGLSYSYDQDRQLIPEDIVEEWSEVALFRKKQEYIRRDVPIYKQQIEK
jgi:hypothetical protein